jgi:Cupin superfamily protein
VSEAARIAAALSAFVEAPDSCVFGRGQSAASRPLVLEMSAGARVRHFDSAWLRTALRSIPVTYPRLRLARDGRLVPHEKYLRTVGPIFANDPSSLESRAAPALVEAQLREGASLVWDRLEQVDGPLQADSSELAQSLGCRVQSNLYVADGTNPGFGKHADGMDVLAMQIEGRKRWMLFDRDATDRVVADITLTPGRALYVPARTPHLVTPIGERSMHVSMSAVRPKLADYLSWSAGLVGEVDIADGAGLRRVLEQMACAEDIARFIDQFPRDSIEA